MKKMILVFILMISTVAFAEDCIELSAFDPKTKSSPEELQQIRETDEIKTLIFNAKYQIGACIEKMLLARPDLEKVGKKKPSIDMKLNVSNEGKIQVKCDCETYIQTSQDLNEAVYRLEVGNCTKKVLEKLTLPKSIKISEKKIFCWDGRFMYNKAPSKPKLSSGTT